MKKDAIHAAADVVTKAVGKTVAKIFNATPAWLRPVAMAALRASVESAVTCFDERDRAAYEVLLKNLECVALKLPKKEG